MRICGQIEFIKHRRVYFCHFLNFYIFFVVFLKTVKMLKLQFLSCKKYSEHWSTVKNCNFSKLQFFKCTSTVISLHIFAVWLNPKRNFTLTPFKRFWSLSCSKDRDFAHFWRGKKSKKLDFFSENFFSFIW